MPGVPVQVILDTFTDGIPQKTGVTAGTSRVVAINGVRDATFWFTSIGTTSGGTLLIEETDENGGAAGWSLVLTVSAADFTGGNKLAAHVTFGAGAFARVRISAAITGGGTVYVSWSGN